MLVYNGVCYHVMGRRWNLNARNYILLLLFYFEGIIGNRNQHDSLCFPYNLRGKGKSDNCKFSSCRSLTRCKEKVCYNSNYFFLALVWEDWGPYGNLKCISILNVNNTQRVNHVVFTCLMDKILIYILCWNLYIYILKFY